MEKSDKSNMFSLGKDKDKSLGEDKDESLGEGKEPLGEEKNKSLGKDKKFLGENKTNPSPSCTTSDKSGGAPAGSQCASVQAAPEANLGAAFDTDPVVANMQLGQVITISYHLIFCLMSYMFVFCA